MKNTEKPLETVVSIQRENWALRWVTIGLSVSIASLSALLIFEKPQPIWLVHENGQIFEGSSKIFSWEPGEASKRGLECFFVPSANRNDMIRGYFTGLPLEAALVYQPHDRFIDFKVLAQSETADGGLLVDGEIYRENKDPGKMSLVLVKGQRTEINPFGLLISSTTIKANK